MAAASLISVGGVAIPVEWQAHQVSVTLTPLRRGTVRRMEGGGSRRVTNAAAGKRTLSVAGVGVYPPAWSTVTWSAPVTITWYSPTQAAGETTQSITVWSDGIETVEDVSGGVVSWTIRGEEQ